LSEDFDKAKEIINEGLKLLGKSNQNNYYQFYSYIIRTYQYMLDNSEEKFLDLMRDEFIPYL